MSKRLQSQLDKYNNKDNMKLSLGILALIGFCSFLIVIATFTQLSFFHYILPKEAFFHPIKFWTEYPHAALSVKYYEYIPQVPVIVYIAALLGLKFGLVSVLIYIGLGLTLFPVFALGGGPAYLLQYNFGYILAYIPAVIIVDKCLKSSFSYNNIAKSSLFAVLIIHAVGILYTLLIAIIKKEPLGYAFNWIIIQSFAKIIYDFIFSFLAIIFAKLTRKVLWVVMG